MRTKRNKNNKTFGTEGYIQKYFGENIGRLLIPSTRSLQNYEIPYVPHQEAENVLKSCLVGDIMKDKSLVFTGLTGSGKTTILRHVFGMETNANKVQIRDNNLIIPVDFNRSQKSAQDAILSSLRVAVRMIVDKYGIEFPGCNNERFYNYIENRRPDFLYLDSKFDQRTLFTEKMNKLCEAMPTPYASCQLQYVMDQTECTLKLVVLIVDNIEAFMDTKAKNTKARFLAPVIEAFKLAECIDQRGDVTKWCFNMVIACRHHIWRILKGEFTDNSRENPLLQSYVTTEKPYDLAKPVKVDEIIKKREEVFSRRQHDREKWKASVEVVNTILKILENSIGDFVMQLELKDIRKSMSKMRELILHRGLQRQSDEEIAAGAFQLDSVEQFDLTKVNIIRVIGLGDNKFYADSNSIIPNLLYNESLEGIELHPLLTLKYFLIRCGYMEPAWDNPISISEFYKTMRNIFGYSDAKLETLFGRSVHFLLQHRLLLRSADQSQEEVPGLSVEEIKEIEYVYVSGSAVKLWEELKNSSALFQLFLDDIWLEEKLDYFQDNGNDIEHCVKYLKCLMKIEDKIFNSTRNISHKSSEAYVEAFGSTPICKHLLDGLIASLETICQSGDSKSQIRVNTAEKTLREAKFLSEYLIEQEEKREKIVSMLS